MAKYFKDFTFLGKKLSELNGRYISVDFEQSPEHSFAFSRDIDYGDTNRFRTEPNVGYSRLSGRLSFELHIVKDPQYCSCQAEAAFTDGDIREITRWLTSTDSSQYLSFTYEEDSPYAIPYYFGQFLDIQPFTLSGSIYGLKLTFECTTPYGYTGEITDTISCAGTFTDYTLTNQDDRLNDYCYPTLRISSGVTGQILFLNLSDCIVHKHGTLDAVSGKAAVQRPNISETPPDDAAVQEPGASEAPLHTEFLVDRINDYALAKGYVPEYVLDEDGNPTSLCEGAAVLCTFVTPGGERLKCMALCRASTSEYYILQGGFLHMKVLKDLPVLINTHKLFIFDGLGRMVKLSELGVKDTDYMYWPRLLNGDNQLLAWGENCTFTITHRETRKAGA